MDKTERKVLRVAEALEATMLADPMWAAMLRGLPPCVEGEEARQKMIAEGLKRLAWAALDATYQSS